MRGKIVIVSPVNYIENEINKIIVSEFNDILATIAPQIQEDIRNGIRPLLEENDTFKEMTTPLSNLNVEIGIPADEAKIKWAGIFDILTSQVYITHDRLKISGSQISGGLIADIIDDDFKEIINSGFGNYVTPEKGYPLNWQEWLLIDGDRIIISDHHVRLVNPLKPSKYFHSRTGGAIMIKRGTWKVPSAHTGTIDDNWLTRLIQTYFTTIEKFVYNSFKTKLKNAI